MDFGGRRFGTKRALKMIRGCRCVSFVEQQVREVVMRGGEVGLQLQRLLIRGDRLVEALRIAQRGREVAVGGRIIRTRRDGAAIVSDRFVELSIGLQRDAEIRLGDGAHRGL